MRVTDPGNLVRGPPNTVRFKPRLLRHEVGLRRLVLPRSRAAADVVPVRVLAAEPVEAVESFGRDALNKRVFAVRQRFPLRRIRSRSSLRCSLRGSGALWANAGHMHIICGSSISRLDGPQRR